MHPLLSLVLFVSVAYAKIVTHIAQSTEIGLEQLDANLNTDAITFFATARIEKDKEDFEYVLSFGPPTCEFNCAQSLNNLCTAAPDAESAPQWLSDEIRHYPAEDDPAAYYIRTTLRASNVLACPNDYIKQEIDLTTRDVTLSGVLYLSIAESCTDGCPVFRTSDRYPFYVVYNHATQNFTGLDYRFSKYSFESVATRNLRIQNVGFAVEIETAVAYNRFEADEQSYKLARIANATIYQQDCKPSMRVVAVTNCESYDGHICNQHVYVAPEDRQLGHYTTAVGSVVLHCTVVSDDGEIENDVVIHVDMQVVNPYDFGRLKRPVDVVLSTVDHWYSAERSLYLQNTPDVATPDTTDRVCVSVASPFRIDTELRNVILCSSPSTNLSQSTGCNASDVITRTLYSAVEHFFGTGVSLEDGGMTVCFDAVKLTNNSHVLAVSYRPTTASFSDYNYHTDGTDYTSTIFPTVYERRRSMFNNSNPDHEDIAHSDVFFIDCPSGFHWDFDVHACVENTGIDSLGTTSIVLLVLFFIVLFAAFFYCTWMPTDIAASAESPKRK